MTLAKVDDMPYVDALDLAEYWRDYPPQHILIRAQVGWKSKPRRGELNQHEQAATVTGSVIPADALPAYVVEAMKRTHEEKLRGR